MERLLTISDVGREAANAAANQAPGRDIVIATANSTKYGGSGGGDYTCLAGGNKWRVELGLHEFGHSFAGLGDEYFDPNGVFYPYGELILDGIGNLSTLYANDMNDQMVKWYRWLDWGPEPKDVWTFEGAFVDYNSGIYRPTEWSMMRALHDDNDVPYPYHQVNTEQFVLKIYGIVNPIDDATPSGTYLVGPVGPVFFVEPLQPATHNLDIQWYLDGSPISGATGATLDVSTLNLLPGEHTLYVNVIDNTDMVRDEGRRATDMNDTREWTLIKRAVVGYWKLDDNADNPNVLDSKGSNNGTFHGTGGIDDYTSSHHVDGKINGALEFDGTNDYVSLSSIAALETNNVTVSAWIKAGDVSVGLHPIFTQFKQDGGYYGYYFYLSGDIPKFYLSGDVAASDEGINTTDWYHVAGTFDGSTLRIYVNGVKKGEYTSNKNGYPHNAYIGYDDVFHDHFTGIIDGVRIYNWALDANEIRELIYESADFNLDLIVNFFDYAEFALAWQTNSGEAYYNEIYDLEDNNSIDYADLAIFCEDWLWQTGWIQPPIGSLMMGQSTGETTTANLGVAATSHPPISSEQQTEKVQPLDIEQIIKWLEELWLDPEVRKTIDKACWQKFMDSIKEGV